MTHQRTTCIFLYCRNRVARGVGMPKEIRQKLLTHKIGVTVYLYIYHFPSSLPYPTQGNCCTPIELQRFHFSFAAW